MTLKTKKLVKSDFDEFIQCYKAEDCSKRRESKKVERWKFFKYDELNARDKTNLDIAPLSAVHDLRDISPSVDVIWLKDESLEDTENLPAPEVLALEIVEQLEVALEEFRSVEGVLTGNGETE